MFCVDKKCFSFSQADMHGILTFVLIPNTQSKPPPVKENVVSVNRLKRFRRFEVSPSNESDFCPSSRST